MNIICCICEIDMLRMAEIKPTGELWYCNQCGTLNVIESTKNINASMVPNLTLVILNRDMNIAKELPNKLRKLFLGD